MRGVPRVVIPFFTVAPRVTCSEGHCRKHDGSAFSTGVPGKAFSVQVRSDEAKEALTAFLEKRSPDFTKTRKPVAAE